MAMMVCNTELSASNYAKAVGGFYYFQRGLGWCVRWPVNS